MSWVKPWNARGLIKNSCDKNLRGSDPERTATYCELKTVKR